MRIQALSLVDITKTGKHKNNSKDDKAIFQNANYLTFQNCIMLRSNIISDTTPKVETMNVVNTTFGTSYSGEHKVWNMIFDTERDEATSGVGIAATIEGARPLLVEIQSLVSSAVYGTPQRSATGYDTKRMNMLLAVLEKRCGFRLGAKDVFLNITGGIKIDDTAIDLAVVCSILSSDKDIALDMLTCFAGEIGLSGEIRAVNRIENRIAEAEKLGYKQIIVSKYNKFSPKGFKIDIVQFGKIEEAFKLLF